MKLFAAALLVGLFAGNVSAMEMAHPPQAKGGMMVDEKGMTLYTFDKDTTPGKSACAGPCAALWPAAMAPKDAKASGDYTVVSRDDGSMQWAYKGKPLYAYSADKKAGDKTGDGFKGIWHVAK